jgi:hypothetical protein
LAVRRMPGRRSPATPRAGCRMGQMIPHGSHTGPTWVPHGSDNPNVSDGRVARPARHTLTIALRITGRKPGGPSMRYPVALAEAGCPQDRADRPFAYAARPRLSSLASPRALPVMGSKITLRIAAESVPRTSLALGGPAWPGFKSRTIAGRRERAEKSGARAATSSPTTTSISTPHRILGRRNH